MLFRNRMIITLQYLRMCLVLPYSPLLYVQTSFYSLAVAKLTIAKTCILDTVELSVCIFLFAGRRNGWLEYGQKSHFTTCPKPSHPACLDQYETDGNLQFKMLQ